MKRNGHTLTRNSAIQRIALYKQRLSSTPTVRLQNVDGLHRVLDITSAVNRLHRQHRIHRHGREEIVIPAQLPLNPVRNASLLQLLGYIKQELTRQ